MVTDDAHARRQREIEGYDALRTAAGRELQALVELAAQIFEVPHAAINLISSTEQHQVATTGFEPDVCAREDSMCAAVVDEPATVVVADASRDLRYAANPFVTGPLGDVRFYASAPLVASSGVPLGRLCVFDDAPREVSAEQVRALSTLADRVMDVLELRRRSRLLEDSLRELTATRDELRRSNQNLDLFAGQVSHDLRSPLTAILANAEVLGTEPAVESDPALKTMVGDIVAAGYRMGALIDNVLAFAREGGRLDLAPVPLQQVVARVLADLEPRVAQTGAAVHVDPLPTVQVDADLVYSVFLNLLTNALKFHRAGVAPRIRVWSTRVDGRQRVVVSDNGVGLPEELHEKVFELFARERGGPEGSGIGLATAKRIVEAHGGRIGVAAHDGPGLDAWFELPGEGGSTA